ncbi:hypothetical protein PHMEG_00019863 [Phytophthora megakarya]|uniref:Uncharacterized protein n=1 Tax=Phytophthora megakarya TaxID=4795 RepID=A0A225VQH0_9STRA|nr:hypothetical protein PHMEG_00019863 [Phytophthora megakarya]
MEELAELGVSTVDMQANDEHESDGSVDSERSEDVNPDCEDEPSSGNEILGSSDDESSMEVGETSIILNSEDLRDAVTRLIGEDTCDKKCLEGKAKELEQFLCSLSQMSSSEKKHSIMTTLAVLKKTDTVIRHRDHGLREQFNYYLPLKGRLLLRGNEHVLTTTRSLLKLMAID